MDQRLYEAWKLAFSDKEIVDLAGEAIKHFQDLNDGEYDKYQIKAIINMMNALNNSVNHLNLPEPDQELVNQKAADIARVEKLLSSDGEASRDSRG